MLLSKRANIPRKSISIWQLIKSKRLLRGDNKELYIVPGASHTDLYDNPDKIPFAKIVGFYNKYLVRHETAD